jgi:large subunit ribosomal protein L7/L12
MAKTATKIDDIMTSIEGMTVLELADLVKKLEEKFDVSAAMPVAAVAAPGAGAAADAGAAVDEVNVVLTSAGDKKIQVLKAIREVTGLGLKEAKELVDTAPKPVKEGIKKAEAEEIKKKIEAEGGKAEIK